MIQKLSPPAFVSLALAAAIAASPALAQDDGLYPEPSAPDASFLRVLVPAGGAVAVNGATLSADATGLTPYVEVAPGPVTVSIDGEEATVEAGANAHYSYVVADAGAALLTDGVTGSPAQADLVVYNLTDVPALDVFVPEADAMALEGVAADANASVALRAPLTLALELRDGESALAQVEGVELVRSAATTVIVEGEAGEYQAVAALNTYAD